MLRTAFFGLSAALFTTTYAVKIEPDMTMAQLLSLTTDLPVELAQNEKVTEWVNAKGKGELNAGELSLQLIEAWEKEHGKPPSTA